ncbi:carbohydrate kinase [Mucilaginibacter sp. CAU 1740]|uniref:carbohydrate kinase family protein n=1 Tax=Mucilaginibacter sp. CAU 1740 TaxID=3140365 RepID=UPI00325BCA86
MMNAERSQHAQVFCFGEILWDLLPGGAQPGGAPLNVAYHLNKLGVSSGIISKVGDDLAGLELLKLIKQWGIADALIQTDDEYATSEVLVKLNSNKEATYEILYPVAWDFISAGDYTDGQLNTADYFVYGSLSSRNKTTRETLLALLDNELCNVLDINLREPYVNKQTLQQLLMKAGIVKFNEAELTRINQLFGSNYITEHDKVNFIQDKFQISEVLVTKGGDGAMCYNLNEAYHAKGPKITVKDTVGSGDAFLAAFIAGKIAGDNTQNNINNAAAMGAFIATQKGGCPEYSRSEFENFKNQIIPIKTT